MLGWGRTLVNKVDYRLIGNASVGGQTYLAGARIGVTILDASGFQLRAQFAQAPGIQFWIGKSFVAGESASTNLGRNEYFA